jgi:hypothetical protein
VELDVEGKREGSPFLAMESTPVAEVLITIMIGGVW